MKSNITIATALVFGVFQLPSFANTDAAFQHLSVSIQDITEEAQLADQIVPPQEDPPTKPGNGTASTSTQNTGSRGSIFDKIDMSKVMTVGNKLWEFALSNKPDATYNTLHGSVVPGGMKSWTELSGWMPPVVKVYRVVFKSVFGYEAGSFEYRISYIYGGGVEGRGNYLGQISFAPRNIKLKTDRKVNIKAELLEPVNFGTVENPLAGVQLLVSWNSPTTLRYEMSSAEYMILGNGQIMDLSNPN